MNQIRAAKLLGIGLDMLLYKMKKFGLVRGEEEHSLLRLIRKNTRTP